MLFEPIEIELDKPRKFFLNTRALMRAEKEINRQRGAEPGQRVAVDYLLFKAASDQLAGSGSFPLDLLMVLVWAGLASVDAELCRRCGLPPSAANEPMPCESALDLIDLSPLTRGQIITAIWNHYNEVTKKKAAEATEEESSNDRGPLAKRPGLSSSALQ